MSNALMALLAGAQLAGHLLQLTAGSDHLLPEVFPKVPHIRRFNLSTAAALVILQDADSHLGAMAVPYALAIHEDFMKTCLSMLEKSGRLPRGTAARCRLTEQHRRFQAGAGGSFAAEKLVELHTLRLMRNCLIHAGGRASPALVAHLARHWTSAVDADWCRVALRSPRTLQIGDPIRFGHGEMIAALAVTKALDREANRLLQLSVARDVWADLVVQELLVMNPSALRTADRARRKVAGIATHYYSALSLTAPELQSAIERATR